jgi:hypothetical protein
VGWCSVWTSALSSSQIGFLSTFDLLLHLLHRILWCQAKTKSRQFALKEVQLGQKLEHLQTKGQIPVTKLNKVCFWHCILDS